jgi:hypothetical protein
VGDTGSVVLFRMTDDGQKKISSAIHRRQNPSESTVLHCYSEIMLICRSPRQANASIFTIILSTGEQRISCSVVAAIRIPDSFTRRAETVWSRGQRWQYTGSSSFGNRTWKLKIPIEDMSYTNPTT